MENADNSYCKDFNIFDNLSRKGYETCQTIQAQTKNPVITTWISVYLYSDKS